MNEGVWALLAAFVTALFSYMWKSKESGSAMESVYVKEMRGIVEEYKEQLEKLKKEVNRLEAQNDHLVSENEKLLEENKKLRGVV